MMHDILLLLIVVPLLQLNASESVQCRSASGYQFLDRRLLLTSESFDQDSLVQLFRTEAEGARRSELQVVACSDPDVFRKWTGPPIEIPPPGLEPPGYRVERVSWPRPVAFLYVFGDSAFFEVWRRDEAPDWVLIRGENVFNRRFGGKTPVFVSEAVQGGVDRDCARTRRELEFVLAGLEGMSVSDLMPIFTYYQQLLPEPAWLQITLFDSFPTATSLGKLRAISPHALAAGFGQAENPNGMSVEYSKFWLGQREAVVSVRLGRTTVQRTKIKIP